uniref:Hypoxanthine phosphoribosyltransferase n=1 Tax=Anisakis simplex TaxID=6269 RepID=A0A0M3K1L6_ANISI
LESFLIPHCYYDDLSSVVIPKGMITDRVKRLAQEINESIGDKPLVMLCILKGSFRFFTALVDELTTARGQCSHPLVVDFIRVKSYADSAKTGTLEVIGLASLDELKGANVLIVEDIIDSGQTLARLMKTLDQLGVKQMWTAILLSKRVKRTEKVNEDFVAFEIPDKFIVGYGLDYNQKFRDLNHICMMSEAGIARYKLMQ